jgi:hypothetical protein
MNRIKTKKYFILKPYVVLYCVYESASKYYSVIIIKIETEFTSICMERKYIYIINFYTKLKFFSSFQNKMPHNSSSFFS